METTESKAEIPEREGSLIVEVLACVVAAIILTASAYGITRWVLTIVGVH